MCVCNCVYCTSNSVLVIYCISNIVCVFVGTGKTLMARQIGKMLHAREPKIIHGPEILDKFVGQSEANIRWVWLTRPQLQLLINMLQSFVC